MLGEYSETISQVSGQDELLTLVSLTEPAPVTKPPNRFEYIKVPDVPTPATTFIFHYRSAEGLNSMQAAVAPALPFRPPPGQPAPSEPAKREDDIVLPARPKGV